MPPEFTLFLDETGNTSMPTSPESVQAGELFLLCGCLLRTRHLPVLTEALAAVKRRYLGPDGERVILVNRRIRKRQGDFAVLSDPEVREPFLEALSELVRTTPVVVFGAAVDKARHWERYGRRAVLPYDLALRFILERVVMRADTRPVRVVAESRGRREDAGLAAEYERLLRDGTGFLSGQRLRDCFRGALEFAAKPDNVAGLQLADLVAYPLLQRLQYPDSRSLAFEVVWSKLHASPRGVWGAGLKVFPDADPRAFGL
ncbi:MAG: DUF3800 domain-containing protein [Armatimonadetes bacterium]|nr:DUF3800 domain-containing protein [Armatimonadota bacterium]